MTQEIFEIYDGEKHVGCLYISGNRHKLEIVNPLPRSPYPFELKSTDWERPIPYFEEILALYNSDPNAMVFRDPKSHITLYLVEEE